MLIKSFNYVSAFTLLSIVYKIRRFARRGLAPGGSVIREDGQNLILQGLRGDEVSG